MTETFATGMNQTSNKTLPDSEDLPSSSISSKKALAWDELWNRPTVLVVEL